MKTWQLLAIFLPVLCAGSTLAAMPEDVSGAPWFDHCRQLSVDRIGQFPDVVSRKITYAWQSDLGYRWDWENGVRASEAEHYCVRLALHGERGRLIENITFLCSVKDRGQQTQVWTFGNVEVAKNICPMGADELARMDARDKNR